MAGKTQIPDLPDADIFSASGAPAAIGQIPSPVRPALIITALLISGEICIMFFIMPLFDFPAWMDAVIDGLLLLLLLILAYLYVFRPYWSTHQTATAKIMHLNRQLLMVAEQERERLAGELHDDAAQYLTALKLAVGTLAHKPAETSADAYAGNIRLLENLVDETHERIRQVVTKLRPPDLEAGGLVHVMRELLKRCEQQFPQVQINFSNHGCHDGSYPLIDIVLYRICQEGICNAVRHTQSTQINIVFSCQAKHLTLEIRDNGQGFDRAADQLTSTGIDGMRKRLSAVGGSLSIESQSGQGTRLLAIIPKHKGERHDSSVCCR